MAEADQARWWGGSCAQMHQRLVQAVALELKKVQVARLACALRCLSLPSLWRASGQLACRSRCCNSRRQPHLPPACAGRLALHNERGHTWLIKYGTCATTMSEDDPSHNHVWGYVWNSQEQARPLVRPLVTATLCITCASPNRSPNLSASCDQVRTFHCKCMFKQYHS